MGERINIAELLKDCPSGMELDCAIYDGVTLDSVVFESEYHYENTYPIKIVTENGFYTRLTKYGQNVDIEEAKCVIFPKGKTTWEGFQRPFVDGDIIADDHGNIAIYKGKMWYNKKLADYYCGYRKSDNKFLIKGYGDGHFGMIEELHYATKEEKRKLFDVIKENDYEWDVENKTLAKKPTFKNGDILTTARGSIFIYKGLMYYGKNLADFYCGYIISDKTFTLKLFKDSYFGNVTECRFATEKEKQKLFQAIKDNGYKWNAETKTLEKLIIPKFKVGDIITNGKTYIAIGYIDDEYYYEINRDIAHRLCIKNQDEWKLVPNKFDIHTLKPYDQVLVRLTNNCVWMPKLFSHYDPKVKYYPFVTLDNMGYPQCIPYEKNRHLCRTTDDCNKFYKVWE